MSGVEGAEREDHDEREAGVGKGFASMMGSITANDAGASFDTPRYHCKIGMQFFPIGGPWAADAM